MVSMKVRYCSNATSHAHVYWLVRTHVSMCSVTSDGTLASLTYCIHVLKKGCTHTYTPQVDTYVGTYTYATCVSPIHVVDNLKRIVSHDAYASDIISDYFE